MTDSSKSAFVGALALIVIPTRYDNGWRRQVGIPHLADWRAKRTGCGKPVGQDWRVHPLAEGEARASDWWLFVDSALCKTCLRKRVGVEGQNS